MIFRELTKFSKKIAFVDQDRREVKYSEIIKYNVALSKFVKKKSSIIILSENSIESLVGYVSLSMLNTVLIPINPQISKESLKKLLIKYLPNFLWINKDMLNLTGIKNYKILLEKKNYIFIEFNKNKNYKINNDLFILLSTSGSIGDPKCVKLTYKNVWHNTISIRKYLNIKSSDRSITNMPWHYSYGMSIINSHISAGASILITNKSIVEKDFWSMLQNAKVTNFNGVPYTYEILQKVGINRLKDLNLRFITQAGGKIENELCDEITSFSKKNKIKFYVMYGQTEASPRMSYVEKTTKKTQNNCIGKPIKGGKFFIIKNNKLIKKNNIIGELCYKGKNIFSGYSNSFKDLSSKNKPINLLKTGDIAKCDVDGNFYIIGRKSRFIKIYGIRIGLDNIENILREKGITAVAILKNDKLSIYTTNKINDELKKHVSRIIKIRINDFNLKYCLKFPLNKNNKISYKDLSKI